MKKFVLSIGFIAIMAAICWHYNDELVTLYYDAINYFSYDNIVLAKNDYFREDSFMYVQNTSDFEPMNSQDIDNLFFTVINSGQETFTFYCPKDYERCLDDVKALASDQTKLSHINNFVHPYNGFKHIEIQYSSTGQVDILINRSYSSDEIEVVNSTVNELYSKLVHENNTVAENIKSIHDYIINNSKYDSARSDYNMQTYKSDIAYGPLLQGRGICGGYSDAMALFLEKMGVKNFKVSSESHVWNAVYLDGKWYHLDLTWDDPITSDNTDILTNDFFLITTTDLINKQVDEHDFDQNVYLELR